MSRHFFFSGVERRKENKFIGKACAGLWNEQNVHEENLNSNSCYSVCALSLTHLLHSHRAINCIIKLLQIPRDSIAKFSCMSLRPRCKGVRNCLQLERLCFWKRGSDRRDASSLRIPETSLSLSIMAKSNSYFIRFAFFFVSLYPRCRKWLFDANSLWIIKLIIVDFTETATLRHVRGSQNKFPIAQRRRLIFFFSPSFE